jgi:hypothetical protein
MVDVDLIRSDEVQRLMTCSAEVILLPPEFQILTLGETVIPEHHPEARSFYSLLTHA